MKKTTAFILAGALCLSGIAARAVADALIKEIRAEIRPDFTIVVDGKVKEFKNADGRTVYPIVYEGTTYLPARSAGELAGKQVYWHEKEKRIEFRDSEEAAAFGEFIGEERALKIALEKAELPLSDISYKKVKLDFDDGIYVYEVEIKSGRTEIESEIKADDGKILSFEKEIDD